MRALVPQALSLQPQLVARYQVELLTVAPELHETFPAARETLTSLAVPEERTRYYSRLRTLRIANGLAEFLGEHLGHGSAVRSITIDDVHQADPTDQEFLAVLLRRLDPARLTIVLAGSAEFATEPDADWPAEVRAPLSGGLPAAIRRWCERVDAPEVVAAGTAQPPGALAAEYVARDGTSDDPTLRQAYDDCPDEDRRGLHDARADELAALGEHSLTIGAIPYHREHGTDLETTGVLALKKALYYCLDMGFYDATVDLAQRGRSFVDWQRQHLPWWAFTSKMATALAALGRTDEALAIYDEARRTTRTPALHMYCAYATAMLLTRHVPLEQRDHEQALAWINQAIAIATILPDQEQRAFETVFNTNGRALIEAHRGDPQLALELVTSGIDELDRELQPDEQRLHRSVLRHNRAQVLTGLGRLEEALADYRAVIEVDPNYPEYHFDLANLLRRLGRLDEALAEYDTTIELGPPFPECYYNRADLHVSRGELDEAIADYTYVIHLDPSNVDAYVNRAGIRADLGETAAAAQDIEAGLAQSPNNPHLLCLRGRLQLEAGQLDAARAALDAVLEADDTVAEAWALRGAVAFEAADLRVALADLSRAAELDATAAILFNRATVHERLGQYGAAIADLDQAIALDPDDPDAHLLRARCWDRVGREPVSISPGMR
jgi:tetratricopeptide (TPR) repeat protein